MLKKLGVGKLGTISSFPTRAQSNESGYAVAEMAMVLPALVMVMFLGLWIVNLGICEFTLQTQVSQVARTLARGEKAQLEIDKAASNGAVLTVSNDSAFVSVMGTRALRVPLPNLDKELILHASATARNEGFADE